MPIHAQFCRSAIWTSKVGHGDLVFDVRAGFSSGSVRARLQVCVQRLCHPGFSKFNFYTLTPYDPGKQIKPHVTLHPCQMHPQCKFGDRTSASSRDTAHKYFCDRLKTNESRSG